MGHDGGGVVVGNLELKLVPVISVSVLQFPASGLLPYQHFLEVHWILVSDPGGNDVILTAGGVTGSTHRHSRLTATEPRGEPRHQSV